MQRLTSSLLALVLVLSLLAGCGGAASSGTDASGSISSSISSSGAGSEERGSGFQGAGQTDASPSSSGAAPSGAASSGADRSSPAAGTPAAPSTAGTVQPSAGTQAPAAPTVTAQKPASGSDTFRLSDVPAYSGDAYVAVHGNEPYFATSGIAPVSLEDYSPLDALGRCGTAYACVGQDIMPTEERGSIGQVKPSGWHTVKYDNVDGKYLYNRCHLIGYQLSAENANTSNLITGTRYLNIEGMLPFENLTADYIKETGNHVAYRVTPVFDGNDLLARGVLMEGWSVEDQGDGVCFCVFAYNVQPGIRIDYATGDSQAESGASGTGSSTGTDTKPAPSAPAAPAPEPAAPEPAPQPEPEPEPEPAGEEYVLNTSSKKFHVPSCSSVDQMKESNKKYFTGSRDEVIAMGYDPCKRCNP